ncbi:hypothetical protein H0H92_013066 [Tricholoma furcatifolium]|nr:hypothetical protein H0H92_013066 [Tricholoma furcatifolium]
MGNAPSNQQRAPSVHGRPRDPSASPSNGSASSTSPHPHPNTHSSLRYKKKSLELPDLAHITSSSARGRQPPPKSLSIPIPISPGVQTNIPGEAGRTIRAPITLPSTIDVHQQLIEHHRDHHRDAQTAQAQAQAYAAAQVQAQRSRYRRIQDMYDEAQSPAVPAPPLPFVPETVTSTLPVGLVQAVKDKREELVPIKIEWRGGGKSIFLARAGDDDWKGRLAMTQESPGSNVYNATVNLPPGTHHIRFLIDDLWRVADHLPTAVDDQGSLANYVAVPITFSPPSASAVPVPVPAPSTPAPAPAPSSSPPVTRKLPPGTSFWSAASSTSDDDPNASHDPEPPSSTPAHRDREREQAVLWTSDLPPELIAAAQEEESYLAASEGQASGPTHRVTGFVPAPNIPPAPGLPRHLDKLILNARAVGPAVGQPGGKGAKGKGKDGERDRDREKGKGREGRDRERRDRDRDQWRDRGEREREDRDRRRDRERDRERDRDRERERDRRGPPQPPPPPPPSEAGTLDAEPDTHAPAVPAPTSTSTLQPQIHTPSSPLTSAESTPPGGLTPTSPPHPSHASHAHAHAPLLPASRPLTLSLDNDNTLAPPTDDGSVLPVPSHAVLQHLSTSAIRNGVLAVGNTTRYRKKYLTTIYYKPTEIV